jgi:hypothetical protein
MEFHNTVELYKKMEKLPDHILAKIYKEYLEPEVLWQEYKDIICSYYCRKLCITNLRLRVAEYLAKPLVCKYFYEKCNAWKYSYKKHKNDGIKCFVKCNKGDSFCLSILMWLYH